MLAYSPECRNKLLLNYLPAYLVPMYREPVPIYREMYVKISNVSTNTACPDEIGAYPHLL